MKTSRYIFAAVVAMALSCEREEIQPESKVLATFDAIAENPSETKVSIDADYVLSWEGGDKIAVWDGSVETLFVADKAGTSTVFKAEGVRLAGDKSYVASYPESASSFSADGLRVHVPNAVKADPGQFPVSPAVAVGNGTERRLEFLNVCGLISFNVVGSDIVSVTIEGGNNEILAGYVTVDPATAGYEPETVIEPSSGIELTGLLAGLYPGKYYIPLLPQNFTNGLKLSMHTTKGTTIERTFDAFDLKRSFYHDLEGIDVGRYFRYEIYTADDLQQFLSDAKDCQSHVVATLVRDIDLKDVSLASAETFAGTFNGNGKSLKNWTATAPLFTNLAESGVVRNLTIASSCTYAMSETSEPQAFVVGVNDGLVTGCTNMASVSYSLTQEQEPVARTFGTIVGICNAKMISCTNLGDIDVTLSAQTGAQHIGGVVGSFSSLTKSVAVEECVNEGNISLTLEQPHDVNLGGVCASGCDLAAAAQSDAVSVGAISDCINRGQVRLQVSAASADKYSNVGGVVGYVEGNVQSCTNEASGTVVLNGEASVSAPSVGGVVGTVVAGSVSGSSNAAHVSLEGVVQSASAVSFRMGGNAVPSVGGIVAKIGKEAEDSSVEIEDCVNSGDVNVAVTGASALNVGGIVGWTSVPMNGSGANTLENRGAVTVEEGSVLSKIYAGGVAGYSSSVFDKVYNAEAGAIDVHVDADAGNEVYVGGVAGYMSKKSANTFKQGHNQGTINVSGGKSDGSARCMVGGVVGFSDATAVTANGTGWAQCNSNYGDISVNCPVIQYVGGVVAKVGNGSTTSKTTSFAQCKNRGNITVASPASGSYIGGVFGHVTRGALGNQNTCGIADDAVQIKVTGATSDTYVGGYIGEKENNHGIGTDAGLWTMRLSGFGMYVSIDAPGATAGLIAGHLKFTGNSSSNIVMLGTNNSERPKIAKTCKLNGTEVGDLTSAAGKESDFFAMITTSSTSTVTGPDGKSMAGRYMFFTAGGTESVSYMDGLQNY